MNHSIFSLSLSLLVTFFAAGELKNVASAAPIAHWQIAQAPATETPTTNPTAASAQKDENSSDSPGRFESDIKIFEALDKVSPPPEGATIFVGSSTFTRWGSDLEQQFRQFKAVNRGFGGSTIPDVNHYVQRIVIKYKPSKIVFYAGANDVAIGHSAEQVFHDYEDFCQKVRKSLPNAEIYFIAIGVAPCRVQFAQTYDAANQLIKQYTEKNPHQHFIDMHSVMYDKDGQLKTDLFGPDHLHMNSAGYALWTPVITSALSQKN